MDQRELDKILQDHKKWLTHSDGWSAEDRANLQFADLRGMDLSETNLCRANLQMADLRGADLHGARLWEADLLAADLQGVDLREAVLWVTVMRDADIRHAHLRRANLRDADLRCADLQGADLRGADLQRARLCNADLRDADLRGADLRGANLWGVDMCGPKMDEATKIDWPMACPETGPFIAWKKVNGHIVKLEIPEDAERSSATTNKCRASKAMVLEIYNGNGTKSDLTEIMSNRCWIYKVGEIVYPDEWDSNRWNECSHGIHFFMSRREAINWR